MDPKETFLDALHRLNIVSDQGRPLTDVAHVLRVRPEVASYARRIGIRDAQDLHGWLDRHHGQQIGAYRVEYAGLLRGSTRIYITKESEGE